MRLDAGYLTAAACGEQTAPLIAQPTLQTGDARVQQLWRLQRNGSASMADLEGGPVSIQVCGRSARACCGALLQGTAASVAPPQRVLRTFRRAPSRPQSVSRAPSPDGAPLCASYLHNMRSLFVCPGAVAASLSRGPSSAYVLDPADGGGARFTIRNPACFDKGPTHLGMSKAGCGRRAPEMFRSTAADGGDLVWRLQLVSAGAARVVRAELTAPPAGGPAAFAVFVAKAAGPGEAPDSMSFAVWACGPA